MKVCLYLETVSRLLRPNKDLISALDNIIVLISNNPDVFKKNAQEKIETKNMPDSLKPLAPLLKIMQFQMI